MRGERAEEEASGEGVGVGALDDSGGIDSKGLGGPDGDMVRTRMSGRDTRRVIQQRVNHSF